MCFVVAISLMGPCCYNSGQHKMNTTKIVQNELVSDRSCCNQPFSSPAAENTAYLQPMEFRRQVVIISSNIIVIIIIIIVIVIAIVIAIVIVIVINYY